MSKQPVLSDDINEYEFTKVLQDKNNLVRTKINKDLGRDLGLDKESTIFVDPNEERQGI